DLVLIDGRRDDGDRAVFQRQAAAGFRVSAGADARAAATGPKVSVRPGSGSCRRGRVAESVITAVWRTCWKQGRSALDFLSQLDRGTPAALAFLPPELLELSEALLDVRDV